jgi:hypothetical protein
MRFQIRKELFRIEVEENKSWLGKRYVAKMYRGNILRATQPADTLEELDLNLLKPNQI